jgi:Concanavalin A-like lectin/glucanases superfamily
VTWRWGALAVLAFACSVYELPPAPESGAAGAASSGRAGDTAGGGSPAAGSPSGGSAGNAVAGGPTGGSAGGAAPGGAPSSVGGWDGTGGDGGDVSVGGAGGSGGEDPTSGGDGGVEPPKDTCPSDPNKLAPGECGCGVPDVATSQMSDCASLKAKLIHRYDFEGTGDDAIDRVGDQDGFVIGAQVSKLNGKGVVQLKGGTGGPYVNLPDAIFDTLGSASFEAWITWDGGDMQQRIFDFGDTTSNVEDVPGTGRTYLFLNAKATTGFPQVGFSLDGLTGEKHVNATAALPTTLCQVVVVADDAQNRLLLYVNGKKAGDAEWLSSLPALTVKNAWLGRSQWERDPELDAVFHEFRIYGAPLSAADVAASYAGGPDPVFLAQ